MKLGIVASVLIAGASLASAQTYSFDCITNSAAVNCAAGESQLSVAVSGPTSTQALFTFTNIGPSPLSLTDVYFDDGTLLGIAAITNGIGVRFSQGATPMNLPGGNVISFDTTQGFSADSDAPVQPNGVNPGETLGILFNLQSGRSFVDVNNDLATGALRIGLHVQGFANGGSESFVNIASPVPEGASAAYLLGGLGLVSLLARRRGARA